MVLFMLVHGLAVTVYGAGLQTSEHLSWKGA